MKCFSVEDSGIIIIGRGSDLRSALVVLKVFLGAILQLVGSQLAVEGVRQNPGQGERG